MSKELRTARATEGYLNVEVVEGTDVWWEFDVRWDGCMHIRRWFNFPKGKGSNDCDTIHICNLRELIERLQKIEATANEHFKGWPG